MLLRISYFINKDYLREKENFIQLTDSLKNVQLLQLRNNELSFEFKNYRDSIAKVLKVRPKQVEKIVTVTNTVIDTVEKEIYIDNIRKDYWQFVDSGKCYVLEGEAYLKNDTISLWRKNYKQVNKDDFTFWRERSKKFLFIKFGRWNYKMKVDSECGNSDYREVKFLK